MEKAAWRSAAARGFGRLVNNGVWKTLGSKSNAALDAAQMAGRQAPALARAGSAASRVMGGKVGKGLMGYGLAGMGGDISGKYDLPGSQLAFNTVMPGFGALFSAPGLITAARMSSQKNKDLLRDDLFEGARAAGGDLISMTNADHRFATSPGLYSQYMRQQGMGDMADQYASGNYKPLSTWGKLKSLFTDSQDLINDRIDHKIHQAISGPPKPPWMRKSGSAVEKKAYASVIGRGLKSLGKALPWAGGAVGVGMVGHSALREKPYDVDQVQGRGYAGAQAKMQSKLDNMSAFERLAVRLDPSLLAGRIESSLPGTIGQWEANTGNKHRPGWLSNFTNSNGKPGAGKYYQVDANGRRHYV